MPWHVSPVENISSILKTGLQPQIGPRSSQIPEEVHAVHLFSTFDDMMDACWLDDAFDDDEELALFHVGVPAQEGCWTEIQETIPPAIITLIGRDLDAIRDNPAYQALDKVVNPFADPESFRATCVEMSAHEFGALVEDSSWEGSTRVFQVYAASYWIEKTPDGHHTLTLERNEWSTADGKSLADLEEKLFNWARAEREIQDADPSIAELS